MKFIIFSIGVAGTNECGVISGVGIPSRRQPCVGMTTGVVCEISIILNFIHNIFKKENKKGDIKFSAHEAYLE
jgi:hypothetical protein